MTQTPTIPAPPTTTNTPPGDAARTDRATPATRPPAKVGTILAAIAVTMAGVIGVVALVASDRDDGPEPGPPPALRFPSAEDVPRVPH